MMAASGRRYAERIDHAAVCRSGSSVSRATAPSAAGAVAPSSPSPMRRRSRPGTCCGAGGLAPPSEALAGAFGVAARASATAGDAAAAASAWAPFLAIGTSAATRPRVATEISHGLIPCLLSWVDAFGQTNAKCAANGYAPAAMRARSLGCIFAVLAVWSPLFIRPASGAIAVEATAPASRGGPGGPALAIKVDLPGARVVYETCAQAKCAVTPKSPSIPIDTDKATLPDASDVTTEVVPISAGRSVVHVRVPLRGSGEGGPLAPAWEGVFAAGAEPLFARVTGWTRGEAGERAGTALLFVDQGGIKTVAKGDIQEDLRICGEDATLLHAEVLEPQALVWRGASLQQ